MDATIASALEKPTLSIYIAKRCWQPVSISLFVTVFDKLVRIAHLIMKYMVTASYSYILHLLQGIHTYISLTIVLFLQSQLTGVTHIVHNYYGSFVFTMGLSYRTAFICPCFITVLWLQYSMSWKLCSIIFVHFLAVLYNNIHLKTNPLCPTLQGHRIIMLLKLAALLQKFRRFRWLVMRTLISRNQYPV